MTALRLLALAAILIAVLAALMALAPGNPPPVGVPL